MAKHELSSFEAALSAAPLHSEVVEMELRGGNASWVWREISQSRIDAIRRAAIQYVEEDRVRKEKGKDEWREVSMDLDSMRANELDLRELHAAMRDHKNPEREACTLETLRARLSPDLQEHLSNAYNFWKASISPITMTDEDIKELCEDIKKNETPVALLMTQYGFRTVLDCLRYMGDQLMTYQTDSSSDTSSGED